MALMKNVAVMAGNIRKTGIVRTANGGTMMARMPDGWVITVESDRKSLEVRRTGSRELVMCKNCLKRGLDNCPMKFYWDSHPAEDDCFCAKGERRDSE